MIPWFEINAWQLGPLKVHAFGVLVGLAIIVGVNQTGREADKRGLDQKRISEAVVWTLVVGFLMSHWVDVIFYYPEKLKRDPLVFFKIWEGISSFGGFVFGGIALAVYFRAHKLHAWKYLDCFSISFACSWILGRAGCSIAHDHPGKITNFFLGVSYPTTKSASPAGASIPLADIPRLTEEVEAALPYIGRHDLGFYEFLFAGALVIFLFATNRKANRFAGYNISMMALIYSPVRFGLDYLRVADKTYFGFTPGQYFALTLFAFGIWMFIHTYRRAQREAAGETTAAEKEPTKAKTGKKKKRREKKSQKGKKKGKR